MQTDLMRQAMEHRFNLLYLLGTRSGVAMRRSDTQDTMWDGYLWTLDTLADLHIATRQALADLDRDMPPDKGTAVAALEEWRSRALLKAARLGQRMSWLLYWVDRWHAAGNISQTMTFLRRANICARQIQKLQSLSYDLLAAIIELRGGVHA